MSDLFDLPFEEEDPEPVQNSQPPAADGRLPTADSRQRRVLSVTELTIRVRDLLEQQIGVVWIEGELSNCRVWNTGHL
jgi:exodeoxyribonuclease VII large subunit